MTLSSRDLRSFEIRFEFELDVPIRFESDGPIRKFRIAAPATFAVVGYHKQHALFNDKFQSFRHYYWDLYRVTTLHADDAVGQPSTPTK